MMKNITKLGAKIRFLGNVTLPTIFDAIMYISIYTIGATILALFGLLYNELGYSYSLLITIMLSMIAGVLLTYGVIDTLNIVEEEYRFRKKRFK